MIHFCECINLALVLQKELDGGILYGGPLAYIRQGDIKTSVGNASDTFEEENNIGGLIGVRWPLKNGVTFDFEAQVKSEVSGGAAVIFPF